MKVPTHFEPIWNGTEPGWVVLRRTEDLEHLRVMFEGGADIRDLKALRAVLPQLAASPANDVLALKGAPHLDLGEHESSEARHLKALCAAQHLVVESHGRQSVRYGIFNEQTRFYYLIEDETILQAVAAEAMRRGVPVRNSIV